MGLQPHGGRTRPDAGDPGNGAYLCVGLGEIPEGSQPCHGPRPRLDVAGCLCRVGAPGAPPNLGLGIRGRSLLILTHDRTHPRRAGPPGFLGCARLSGYAALGRR